MMGILSSHYPNPISKTKKVSYLIKGSLQRSFLNYCTFLALLKKDLVNNSRQCKYKSHYKNTSCHLVFSGVQCYSKHNCIRKQCKANHGCEQSAAMHYHIQKIQEGCGTCFPEIKGCNSNNGG